MTEKKRFTHEKWYDERKIKENGELFAIVDVYNQADKICNRLNELFDENEELKQLAQRYDETIYDYNTLKCEFDDVQKENEQLKKTNQGLYDELQETMGYLSLKTGVEKKNEQLKKDVDYWKQVASQYSNELNVFEHCKKYKTECKDIHWSSDFDE